MAARVVEETKNTIYHFGPDLIRSTYLEKYPKPRQLGRLQATAGPHKSGGDPHIAGRALDIILDATVEQERAVADQLVDVFLTMRERMRWGGLIYNGEEWNSAGIKFPRTGSAINRHLSHIHIEWGAKSAEQVDPDDFKPLLICMLMQVR
ncbi:hypothetical protein [Lysobacter gummosus]|uniref:Uncharacterized protein n=1 Tax=Lysobacter gummosus TaxID=262324 RepID=A0ABY3XJQ4_9GAMM|nr:hypothetical protein [Lysobacter gummosus]UNP31857.1 hypothetical protein MOV92_11650 [Lysobacter gummosus]